MKIEILEVFETASDAADALLTIYTQIKSGKTESTKPLWKFVTRPPANVNRPKPTVSMEEIKDALTNIKRSKEELWVDADLKR